MAFWDQRNAGSASGNNNMDKLSLPQMINDMEVIVKVLKFRYNGASVFLYAHSFGGLLAAGYLVKDSNQNNLKGWVEIDGAHNYPLCNASSRKMLMDTAASEINKGSYTSQWQNILDYCSSHDPLSSYKISSQTRNLCTRCRALYGINKKFVPVPGRRSFRPISKLL